MIVFATLSKGCFLGILRRHGLILCILSILSRFQIHQEVLTMSVLNNLGLVLVFGTLLLHTGLYMTKACCAFLFLTLMSSSVPPGVLTVLPKYVKSLMSSNLMLLIFMLSVSFGLLRAFRLLVEKYCFRHFLLLFSTGFSSAIFFKTEILKHLCNDIIAIPYDTRR